MIHCARFLLQFIAPCISTEMHSKRYYAYVTWPHVAIAPLLKIYIRITNIVSVHSLSLNYKEIVLHAVTRTVSFHYITRTAFFLFVFQVPKDGNISGTPQIYKSRGHLLVCNNALGY